MVSSAMASTRPAPKSGIGTRRAKTFASCGTRGWHSWTGSEKRWNMVSPPRTVKLPFSSTWPACTSETGLIPPIAGVAWHCAQLSPLKAGPSPSAASSTSRKSSRPMRKNSNSCSVIPGSGLPGCEGRPAGAPLRFRAEACNRRVGDESRRCVPAALAIGPGAVAVTDSSAANNAAHTSERVFIAQQSDRA